MTAPMLKTTQEWLMTVLAVRGDLRQKVMSATHGTGVDVQQLIKAGAGPNPMRRLDIYAAGYVMRLVECLRAEYKTLQAFMGEEVFDGFAKAYIVTLPSANRSLYDLGAHFPGFLAETKPHGANAPEDIAMFAVPAEIAAVERARAETLLSEGFEGQAPTGDVAVADFALLHANLSVALAPCLRLLALDYPVQEMMAKLEAEAPFQMPQAQPTWLGLSRVNFQPVCVELEQWQYAFLQACHHTSDVVACAKKAAKASKLDQGDLLARLMLWLPVAASKGLLRVSSGI